MDYAFEYIKNNGSITTEKSYPYVAKQRSCDNSLEESQVVTVDGYQDVPRNNENALLKAVANQPVSVAIEASGYDFQFYSGLFVARSVWFAMEGKMGFSVMVPQQNLQELWLWSSSSVREKKRKYLLGILVFSGVLLLPAPHPIAGADDALS